MLNCKDVDKTVRALLTAQCYSATKFLSATQVIRVTHPRYACRNTQWSKRARRLDLRLTIGEPNYRERQFIAACKKAGEPLPVRKIQLRDFPRAR